MVLLGQPELIKIFYMHFCIRSNAFAGVMAALGDKIAANILAQTAKVPSIPWSGDGLTCELTDEGTIPEAR